MGHIQTFLLIGLFDCTRNITKRLDSFGIEVYVKGIQLIFVLPRAITLYHWVLTSSQQCV